MTRRDRQGQPIDLTTWAGLWEDLDYRVIAEDRIDGILVRTVWEGIDDPFGVGAMFATGISHDGKRYRTVAEEARTEPDALVQHRDALARLRGLHTVDRPALAARSAP
jgi:hypothetical protein